MLGNTFLGCGKKAGGTTRTINSASLRNPRAHPVQTHPEIKIWEPPNQHHPANCTSAAPCPLSKGQSCGSQPYSDTAVIKMSPPLIHSLQNTFFSFNNHAKHVSVWTTPQTLSERPADVTLSLKVRHQNTNFSLDWHTPKHRELSCALKHMVLLQNLSPRVASAIALLAQKSLSNHTKNLQ